MGYVTVEQLKLKPFDDCFSWRGTQSVLCAFDSMLPFIDDYMIENYIEPEKPDPYFNWLIINDICIEPTGMEKIRCGAAGTGEGTNTSYTFEYTVLIRFTCNMQEEIKTQYDRAKTKKDREHIMSVVLWMIEDKNENIFWDYFERT